MKSMVSNRTKTEYGRVSVSMSEKEATDLLEFMDLLPEKPKNFYAHLVCCINDLNNLKPYSSRMVYGNNETN